MTCPACVSPSSHNRTSDGYPGGVGVDPVVLNLCETRGGRGMHVDQRFVNTTAPATTSDSQPWLSPRHVQKARPSSPRDASTAGFWRRATPSRSSVTKAGPALVGWASLVTPPPPPPHPPPRPPPPPPPPPPPHTHTRAPPHTHTHKHTRAHPPTHTHTNTHTHTHTLGSR